MTHGDLIPGNVLVSDGRLTGVIDVGWLGAADPALDGRAWAFQQAMGLVWYYAESNPAMSDLGWRTLNRIVNDTV